MEQCRPEPDGWGTLTAIFFPNYSELAQYRKHVQYLFHLSCTKRTRFLLVPSGASSRRPGAHPHSHLFHLQLLQGNTDHLQVLTCSIWSCSRKARFASRFRCRFLSKSSVSSVDPLPDGLYWSLLPSSTSSLPEDPICNEYQGFVHV